MVKYIIFTLLLLFFLLFSFSPTVFEISMSNRLADPNREFILEHNYYWPDFNLYLSKIRQGWEGRWTALERYTSEKHTGSLLQEFYVILGHVGRAFDLDPNFSYQMGRLVLSPLLLLIILLLVRFYFNSFLWQIIAFIIVVASTSFPRFYSGTDGVLHIGRYMEWWSNIDSLQRITFIPHILFGQVVSFYLLFQFISLKLVPSEVEGSLKLPKLLILILLGNLIGLVFPPSLMTLNGVLLIIVLIKLITSRLRSKRYKISADCKKTFVIKAGDSREGLPNRAPLALSPTKWSDFGVRFGIPERQDPLIKIIFFILSLPSLLYIFFLTKQVPWSALVDFHRTHPMMIPFWQYILGTGPIFFLGLAGAIVAIVKRDRKFQPLILWILVTFLFAVLFTYVKEQSPLRFTQTGLFIPLGILGAYLFYHLLHLSYLGNLGHLSRKTIKVGLTFLIAFYILTNLFMMKVSYDWQTTFIKQRIGANIPPVPYPPQTMYPLKAWMDGIRYLRNHTNRHDVVIAEITAGNFIPAYSGNIVFFGQSNTLDYNRKQLEMEKFFAGQMKTLDAQNFLKKNGIKYIFFSLQEKERAGGKELTSFYPFLKSAYSNSVVTIYQTDL